MRVEIVNRPLPPAVSGSGCVWPWLPAILLLAFGFWLQGRPELVGWQLARDHRRGLAARPGARIWSSEPRVVSAWLERHGTELPPLPEHAGEAALVGAGYCGLLDRVVAHVLYEGDDGSVSLFVVTGRLRAPVRWSGRIGGLHLELLRSAGRTLAIVGESDADVRAALRSFATTEARALPAAPSRSG
jgi:hypothetical protein